jgi:hypothetical protein
MLLGSAADSAGRVAVSGQDEGNSTLHLQVTQAQPMAQEVWANPEHPPAAYTCVLTELANCTFHASAHTRLYLVTRESAGCSTTTDVSAPLDA